ncbi:MAG: lipid II flippase MurJ, partial [Candidatus Thorarchaeota archaeon]
MASLADYPRAAKARRFGHEGPPAAFFQASRIPDLVYFLIAGGAARTAFVPVFTEHLTHGRVRQAWRVFSTMFWLLFIFGGVVVVGGSV